MITMWVSVAIWHYAGGSSDAWWLIPFMITAMISFWVELFCEAYLIIDRWPDDGP